MPILTTVLTRAAQRFPSARTFVAAAALVLAVAACSSDGAVSPTPGDTPTERPITESSPTAAPADDPTPEGDPTPGETPSATPTPHVTPPPTLAPVPVRGRIALSPESGERTSTSMLAGLDMDFNLSGFSPLEEFTVQYLGPNGERRSAGRGRADTLGEATWTKPTSRDAMGDWTAQVRGSGGSTATAEWTLVEMPMAAPVVASLEREFKLYHIA